MIAGGVDNPAAADPRADTLVRMLDRVSNVYTLQTTTLHKTYKMVSGQEACSVELVHRSRRNIFGAAPVNAKAKTPDVAGAGRDRDVPKRPKTAGLRTLARQCDKQVRTAPGSVHPARR